MRLRWPTVVSVTQMQGHSRVLSPPSMATRDANSRWATWSRTASKGTAKLWVRWATPPAAAAVPPSPRSASPPTCVSWVGLSNRSQRIPDDGWSPGAPLLHHSTLTQAGGAAGGAVHPCPIPRLSTSPQAAVGDPRAEAPPTHRAAPRRWWGGLEGARGQQKQDGCSTFVCGREIAPAKWQRQLSS